jgi:sulfide:quinone oxidoreductase
VERLTAPETSATLRATPGSTSTRAARTCNPNVFTLGDCSSLPRSRTGAAIRKQAPVLVANLLALRDGASLAAAYDGNASCPLVTGYGRLILAELDYDGKPVEAFPFDPSQERYSMDALTAYGLPELYWNGVMRGRM